jgi:hypothetical protein
LACPKKNDKNKRRQKRQSFQIWQFSSPRIYFDFLAALIILNAVKATGRETNRRKITIKLKWKTIEEVKTQNLNMKMVFGPSG